MAITLEEARNLKPDVTILHFGDEDTQYIVKLVAVGYNMPVYVQVERYPEPIEGLETFFTEHQLHLVNVVGELKDEAAPDGTSETPTASASATPLSTPQQAPERTSEAWQRAYQFEARDPGAGATGDEARTPDSSADTSLEVPRAEETGPDQGREVREDLNEDEVRPARRRKYKRG